MEKSEYEKISIRIFLENAERFMKQIPLSVLRKIVIRDEFRKSNIDFRVLIEKAEKRHGMKKSYLYKINSTKKPK
jgi:hypothetical protein